MNICSDITYLNSVNQKNRFQLFNIPPVRYDNLAKNPYQQINPNTGLPYTKFDVDMRRKAEILKYSSNRMSTQTNSATKAQRFTQAVMGKYQQRTFSRAFITENARNGILDICPSGIIIKTPTTASDVPGTPIFLYDDPTVPLYNLINDTNTPYAIINQKADPYIKSWDYSKNTDILCDNQPVTIFTLYIFNVDTFYYLFSFSTPFSLFFSGNMFSGVVPSGNKNTFTIQFSKATLSIMYSYSTVTLTTTPTYSRTYNNVIDVSLNTGVSAFSGACYCDIIDFQKIRLPVSLGNIYDIQLELDYIVTYTGDSTYTRFYEQPKIITRINTTNNTTSQINCVLQTSNPPPSPPPLLSITGVPEY